MYELVKSINHSMEENGIDDGLLSTMFETFYPQLETNVNEILKSESVVEVKSQRTDRELLEEVLEILRKQNNETTTPKFAKELLTTKVVGYERLQTNIDYKAGDQVIADEIGEGVVQLIEVRPSGRQFVIVDFGIGVKRAYPSTTAMLQKNIK